MSSSSLRCCTGLVYAITGGGGGIGGATAMRLAELGAAGIAIADVNEEGMEIRRKEIIETYPDCKVTTTKVDVADAKQVEAWTDFIIAEFGRLDGAGNIAGGENRKSADARITDISDEDWQFAMGSNLTGTMNCMRAQLKVITRPGGSILNCSSGAGMRGLPSFASYGAAKWGIRGLSRTAAVEFGPEEIRVNTLVPGPIKSSPKLDELAAQGLLDLGWMANHTAFRRLGRTDEIAKTAAFLLSPDSSYVTGIDVSVDGGGDAMVGYRNDMKFQAA